MASGHTVTVALIAILFLRTFESSVLRQTAPIRSGIDLVTIDFSVHDGTGRSLADLTPDQVTIKVGGTARAVKSLQYIHVAPPELGPPGGRAVTELAPPYGSNYLGDAGRTIILVIENESLRASVSRPTLDAAARFVSGLSRRDRVALLTTPRGGLLSDLTRDHAHIQRLLSGISRQGSQRATDSDRACRARDTLVAPAGMLEGLASIDLPKTVVLVSGGIVTPRRDAAANRAAGPCELRAEQFDAVGKAAIGARANLFIIKADDLVIDPAANAIADPAASRFRSSDEELAGLENLTGVTNGTLLHTNPSDSSAFARVARETSGYYVAAVEPEASERNGLSHRVNVSVSRPGASVRVRPRVVIPKPGTRSAPPAQTPQAMLRDGGMYRDLPLRAAAFSSATPGEAKLKIVAVAESLDPSSPLASASFGLIDSRGTLIAQWTANERELSRSPVMSAGLAPPGTYRLRVAALDAAGRRGATDYEFEAALVAGAGVDLSTLVLGVSLGGFAPRLQFGSEPTAMGFFELYGRVQNPDKLTVAFELASEPEGPAIVRTPGTVTVTREPDIRRASGVVPIGALPPGDFVVRGILELDGTVVGQVHRTLRKSP